MMRTSGSVLAIFAIMTIAKTVESAGWKSEAVHFMEPGERVENDKPGLRIFCHNANSKNIIHVWKTVIMSLKTNLETYELYEGRHPHEVEEKHEDNQKYWRFNLFSTKKNKQFRINPFEDSCIGVYMNPQLNQFQYTMVITKNNLDSWQITMLVLGIFFVWFAQALSRNKLFYYVCSIIVGVALSILILIYFMGKLLPKGKFMYLMMATGYTMSFYVVQMLYDNAQLIAMQHWNYVMYYILTTSLISFAICYRFGPVTNNRTKNIIEWILKLFGLVLVYHSSYFREASTAFCVLLVLFYNFPVVFFHKSCRYWSRQPQGRLKSNSHR
ncbi:nuclear envelope integral membrane protein isoform X2 [Phymastichus coffea]|uniref:nuclear envelope integral membrane protein isoform X2 n=1 Tax=Phymastichus coffea TaxID=108790 RepID=UPI00273BF3D2|nr:nuclear envelope integral membrane protein isoform X2 [Phymastichus coffea]